MLFGSCGGSTKRAQELVVPGQEIEISVRFRFEQVRVDCAHLMQDFMCVVHPFRIHVKLAGVAISEIRIERQHRQGQDQADSGCPGNEFS
jgi:hypothetical protein